MNTIVENVGSFFQWADSVKCIVCGEKDIEGVVLCAACIRREMLAARPKRRRYIAQSAGQLAAKWRASELAASIIHWREEYWKRNVKA